MNTPTTYEIVIRGRATDRLLGPLTDDFVVDNPVSGRTRLTGVIRDSAHLQGVMAYLTSVTAEVISLAPSDPDPVTTSTNTTTSTTSTPTPTPTTTNTNERHNQ